MFTRAAADSSTGVTQWVKLDLSHGQNGHECCRLAFPKFHLFSMFREAQVKNQAIVICPNESDILLFQTQYQ